MGGGVDAGGGGAGGYANDNDSCELPLQIDSKWH